MKLPSFALFLVAGSLTLWGADNCDCTHFPIKPRTCATVCASKRLDAAADVLNDLTHVSDKGVPQDILDKAKCVLIVPGLKRTGSVFGAGAGRGFASCRRATGTGWTAPAAIRMEGGSIGFQIGGSVSDVVLLVTNKSGTKHLLSDKFTLGGDASAGAGPVGRDATAQTDAELHTEMLSYSRSRGVFSGVSLEGVTLRPDSDTNQELYGRDVSNREILSGKVNATGSSAKFEGILNRTLSPRIK